MAEKIYVNGASIDKDFFQENLEEAKLLSWKMIDSNDIHDHKHCIVCTKATSNQTGEVIYKAGKIFLCNHCYENYIAG